jgi:pyruvate/2-oxoglutarate dehydrogenase complex dihydrolipoamide acyltransferase (E2) component
MAVVLVMPKLGLTMTEGTIARWLVEVGGRIEQGRPICEVETDKITTEVEAPGSGTLLRRVEAETLVPVGDGIAVIGEPDEDVPGALHGESSPTTVAESATPVGPTTSPATSNVATDPSDRGRVSPVARRRAAELGVDLASIRGSGPGGRIVLKDVESVAGDGES